MSARMKPRKIRNRQLDEVREVDPDGRIVVHHWLVDTLGRMLRSGTIVAASTLRAVRGQAGAISTRALGRHQSGRLTPGLKRMPAGGIGS